MKAKRHVHSCRHISYTPLMPDRNLYMYSGRVLLFICFSLTFSLVVEAQDSLSDDVHAEVVDFLGPQSADWRVALLVERFDRPLQALGDSPNTQWARERFVADVRSVLLMSDGLKTASQEFIIKDNELFLSRALKSMDAIRNGDVTSQSMDESTGEFNRYFVDLCNVIVDFLGKQEVIYVGGKAFSTHEKMFFDRLYKNYRSVALVDDANAGAFRSKALAGYIVDQLDIEGLRVYAMSKNAVDNIFYVGEGIAAWQKNHGRNEEIFELVRSFIADQLTHMDAPLRHEISLWFVWGYSLRVGIEKPMGFSDPEVGGGGEEHDVTPHFKVSGNDIIRMYKTPSLLESFVLAGETTE